jgi:hypothetical protein
VVRGIRKEGGHLDGLVGEECRVGVDLLEVVEDNLGLPFSDSVRHFHHEVAAWVSRPFDDGTVEWKHRLSREQQRPQHRHCRRSGSVERVVWEIHQPPMSQRGGWDEWQRDIDIFPVDDNMHKENVRGRRRLTVVFLLARIRVQP